MPRGSEANNLLPGLRATLDPRYGTWNCEWSIQTLRFRRRDGTSKGLPIEDPSSPELLRRWAMEVPLPGEGGAGSSASGEAALAPASDSAASAAPRFPAAAAAASANGSAALGAQLSPVVSPAADRVRDALAPASDSAASAAPMVSAAAAVASANGSAALGAQLSPVASPAADRVRDALAPASDSAASAAPMVSAAAAVASANGSAALGAQLSPVASPAPADNGSAALGAQMSPVASPAAADNGSGVLGPERGQTGQLQPAIRQKIREVLISSLPSAGAYAQALADVVADPAPPTRPFLEMPGEATPPVDLALGPSPLAREIRSIAAPFRDVGLLALLAYSIYSRRPIRLHVLGSDLPLLETYMPAAVDRMGGYLPGSPMTLAICRTQRFGLDTEVVLPKSFKDLPLCNHFTPLVPTDARDSGYVHENCRGLRCGGYFGWPCISEVAETVAPMGFMPWPVPGDGDCLWHSLLWLEGRDSMGAEGLGRRAQLRRAIAHFIEREDVHYAFSEVLPFVGDAVGFDAPASPPPPAPSTPQPPSPAPLPPPGASPTLRPAPAIFVDDDGLLTSDAVFDLPALLHDECDGLQHDDGDDGDDDHDDGTAAVNAIAAAFRLQPCRDAAVLQEVVRGLSAPERAATLALVPMSPEGAPRGESSLVPSARASGPRLDPAVKRNQFYVGNRAQLGDEFRRHCDEQGVPSDQPLPRGFMDDWWKRKFGRPITHAEKMHLLRCRKLADNLDAKSSPQKAVRFAATVNLGRPVLAESIHRNLFKWFCSIRGSVKGRIPLRLLQAQAERLRKEYIATCVRLGQTAHIPVLSHAWFLRFRSKHRISLRLPNKRWKVPMPVFKERVRILWCNIIRIRHAILLIFGYDPDVDGWDQKPFHMNEAGSKYQKTLSFSGGEVELKEGHSATRERWTACTYTTSSLERAMRIPPLEIMFKGGPRVFASLQDFKETLRASEAFGNLGWLSLCTGDSGSYKAEDVLAYLQRHLEPWGPGRRWRILTADDYKGHKDPRIFQICWERGYLLILIGGGITGAVQTCDTHLHLPMSTKYQHAEMAFLAEMMDLNPAGLPLMSRCDCTRELCAIYGNPALHAKVARAGTRDNMFTLPLDGSGKHLGNPKLRELWDELEMDKWTRHIVADLNRSNADRRLEWTLDFAHGLLEPCPKRCQLDEYEELMDDEGDLVDPAAGRPLWDDNAGAPSPDASDVEDEAQAEESLLAAVAVEDEGDAPGGMGPAPASQSEESLPAAAAVQQRALEISMQLAALDALREQAKGIGDPKILAAVRRARGDANKRLVGKGQEDALVSQAVDQIAERQEDERRAKRARHQALVDVQRRIEDDRARTQAIREQVLEEKRKVATALHKIARQKECDDAEIRLNAADFSPRLAGKAKSSVTRWQAFQRILELAGPLPADLANSLHADWVHWDKVYLIKWPHLDDWGNKFLNFMRNRLEDIRNEKPDLVHSWWVRQRGMMLGAPALTLPALTDAPG